MRVRKGRALKQAVYIVLFIATLSIRLLPPEVVEFPRAFMMDAAAAPAAPLRFFVAAAKSVLAIADSSGSDNAALRKEFAGLTAELAAAQSELARARQALASYNEYSYVFGRPPIFVWNAALNGYIVGADADLFSRSYVTSVGERDGVVRGLPVVSGRTALGVVSDVGLFHSRVRILGDARSRICIRFARSGYEGVLVGRGRDTCEVRFVSNRIPDDAIAPGDLVVTSGTDGIFPPDFLVGKVSRFYKRPAQPGAAVEVLLSADFSNAQNCLVLRRKAASDGR